MTWSKSVGQQTGSGSSMHLSPGVCLPQLTFARITNMTFDIVSHVCLFRSVRPRLTVYICQESPQESPLLERHSTNENGEHSITSSLHGKKEAPVVGWLLLFF